ncbi:MAG: AraC family transcriptional regulator, partial [Bacillota bacterium]|nr:AraC family transcriptional regulator [Bacillota bacterium]
FTQKIYIKTLADLCHMSCSSFRRNFKTVMHCTVSEYINKMRINKTCELLFSTEIPILDISNLIGYESVSSLNRYFQWMMGTTPLAWRKSVHNINKNVSKKGCSPVKHPKDLKRRKHFEPCKECSNLF